MPTRLSIQRSHPCGEETPATAGASDTVLDTEKPGRQLPAFDGLRRSINPRFHCTTIKSGRVRTISARIPSSIPSGTSNGILAESADATTQHLTQLKSRVDDCSRTASPVASPASGRKAPAICVMNSSVARNKRGGRLQTEWSATIRGNISR